MIPERRPDGNLANGRENHVESNVRSIAQR